jgi:hypothetical protein
MAAWIALAALAAVAVAGLLVALLARRLPARGAHACPPDGDDTIIFPRIEDDDRDVPASWLTQIDLPPRLDRPYVDPGSGEEDR